MKIPTIHNNGTPRLTLLGDYQRAYETIHDAMEALQATAPNGRDYYPQGEAAIEEAQHEHATRMEALTRVYAELMEIIVVINQGEWRCKNR